MKGRYMKYKINGSMFKESLLKLNKQQLKLFYSILVHYWLRHKAFISNQNFLNLWCELNYICHEVDRSFPEAYDDYELMKSFYEKYPCYFIDALSPELIIKLIYQHFDKHLDILINIVEKLENEDLRTLYDYIDKALKINKSKRK